MASITFALFAGICLLLLVRAIANPIRMYQFPYFMAASFGGFILPQAYGIYVSGAFVEDWKAPLFLQCFLCMLCCWMGYNRDPKPGLIRKLQVLVNPDRFAIAGVVLIMFGYYFDHLISLIPPEQLSTQGTGIYTIYLFFANETFTGFSICFYCALIYKKRVFWIATAVGCVPTIVAVTVYGRRDPAAMLMLTIAVVIFFAKRITPPSWLVAAILILGTLLIPATQSFRQAKAQGQSGIDALMNVNYKELFARYSEPTTVSEVKNGMYVIQAALSTGFYGYGVTYWNKIVFGFVPAQFVGRDFKDSLMLGDRAKDPEKITGLTGYAIPTGSTITCVADTFQQFWFFGALFYALVGIFFRNLWTSAVIADNPVIRIFYIQSAVGAMRSVSHGSDQLIPAMIYSAIFLVLVVLFARVKPDEA